MIQLKNIRHVYGSEANPVIALHDLSLTVREGEFIAIMGASGSGKSTLMNLIGCLDRPMFGTYILDDAEIHTYDEDELATIRNKKLGFVFQQFNLLNKISAMENVMLPLVYAGVKVDERLNRAQEMLTLVGLADRMHHTPVELSGGQQQRVSMARALVNKPQVLLADEPTGALDSTTSDEIMQLLVNLHKGGLTIVLVTHNSEVATYADRVVTLKDGRIISDTRVR